MSMLAPRPPAGTRASGRRAPIFLWVHGYDRGWLRGDLIAGLTVWAVLVPEALAYATIAGGSPVVGLYAAPGALILYAAVCSSRHLVTGPMAATGLGDRRAAPRERAVLRQRGGDPAGHLRPRRPRHPSGRARCRNRPDDRHHRRRDAHRVGRRTSG